MAAEVFEIGCVKHYFIEGFSDLANFGLIRDRLKMREIPAVTPEAEAMSKDLKKRGFTFVGPTICYAMMQSCGMVNDHLASCWKRVDN